MADEGTDHTFLFADLAGFTALTETHGDDRAAGLAGEFWELVRGLLPPDDAEEVKTIGDAVMVRLASPSEAVGLGLAIVEATRERAHFPAVRVGMHTGPAVERGGDWFGASVNLAARVAAAARGDEVLLSEATNEATGALEEIEIESRGTERLRNVRDPVRLFAAFRAGASRERLPVDPVCRMTVASEHCAGHVLYEGARYCFCSLECVGKFSADPERYLEGPDTPASGH